MSILIGKLRPKSKNLSVSVGSLFNQSNSGGSTPTSTSNPDNSFHKLQLLLQESDPQKQSNATHHSLRSLVSKKKIRFRDGKFDLDLSYVTDRIIAMGFPSEKAEQLYRNPMSKVQKFLKSRHQDHYKVYNLCSERDYLPEKFEYRAVKFPFDDHNSPPLELIDAFCKDLEAYLDEHEDNVGVIHCKAGKGRTGVMCCAYLLYKFYKNGVTADQAMKFYAIRRTKNAKGVTINSQRRFIYYYESTLLAGVSCSLPSPRTLRKVTLHTVPDFDFGGGCDPWFSVESRGELKLTSEVKKKQKGAVDIEFSTDLFLDGEVRMRFFDKDSLSSEEMFYFWFHTAFVPKNDQLTFSLDQLDGKPRNKKSREKFHSSFTITCTFAADEDAVSLPQVWNHSEPEKNLVYLAKKKKGSREKSASHPEALGNHRESVKVAASQEAKSNKAVRSSQLIATGEDDEEDDEDEEYYSEVEDVDLSDSDTDSPAVAQPTIKRLKDATSLVASRSDNSLSEAAQGESQGGWKVAFKQSPSVARTGRPRTNEKE
eukprot:TRINITY_DN3060_c0_g1_i1.p1 TRINITY_DN3060_c0_g1~~TRINITY_DN3060_c0_g1_i1.p1  ORF type:complete len:562 (-),score=138.67 TRINITY_DN3060_c0_g1_i1:92-1708(-)